MATNIPIATIMSQVRQRADMVNSTFVSDTELLSYINAAGAELHDLLVTRYEDEYTYYRDSPLTAAFSSTDPTILDLSTTTSTGVGPIMSTDHFYKLRRVEYKDGDRWRSIKKVPLEEWDSYRYNGSSRPEAYTLIEEFIYVLPAGLGSYVYRVWFVPGYTDLTTSSTFKSKQNWHEYIIVDAAIRCLQKEESDVSVLMAQKAALIDRIKKSAATRDAGAPTRVAEVRSYDEDYCDWLLRN